MTKITLNKNLTSYKTAIDAAAAQIKKDRILERIWDIDHTVWSEDPTEISNRLGWLLSPTGMQKNVDEINLFVADVQAAGYTDVLLLGMGGSSLAPEVFRKTFGVAEGYLELQVLDSTDPDVVAAHAKRLDFSKTLFIVATKSGGTAETLSFFKYFFNRVSQEVGIDRAGEHFAAITDPGSKLVALAEKHDFRATFLNDPNIGGRYSVLSYFGLVPAALVGVDLNKLLERASAAAASSKSVGEALASGWLGAAIGVMAKHGRDKLTFISSPEIESFGDWVEQLIAESTGKLGKGILPVVTENLGAPSEYGDDRFFVHLNLLDGDGAIDATWLALEEKGHPMIRVTLADAYDLGAQFFLWEMATAVSGHVLEINPFDQPNVESAKIVARAMIAAFTEKGKIPTSEIAPLEKQTLDTFLSEAAPPNYVSIHAYVPPTAETDALLQKLSLQIRKRYKVATTIGYGPRFLHSTGQLHKGDGGNGLFIQFTSDAENDVPIPDEAGAEESTMPFGVLKLAQAVGDGQALLDEKRKLIRFHLGTDVIGGLKKVID